MRQFFSTILSQAYSRKKLILGGLAIALFVSLVPLQIAHAGFFDGLINVIIKGAAGLVDALVAPITLLVKFIAGLIGDVMYEAVKFFTNIPIVPPKAPDAIANGWNFTRNLVNIIFILILTFIGLATILRLQTYQLQKTLPSLIIIALLVNFSTVLVGFIVDIGNIFTNAFLGEAAGADWKNIGSFSFSGNPAANLATHIAEIFYYLFAILIYFVIILLFAVRAVILWVLTILSPIAFGAFILPGTKKYWTQWLQQLIQWSILGIPISFSLFLAKEVLTSANFGTKLGLADGSAPAALMAPFTALVLLFVGITLSMQMAPAGAQGVINMGKKAGLKAGGWAAREGWRKIGKKTEAGAGAVRKRGQEIAARAEEDLKTAKFGSGKWMRANFARFGGKALSAASSGIEMGSQKGNLAVSTRDRETITKAEKGTSEELFNRIDAERAATAAKGGLLEDTSKELGAFTGIIKNGDTDDIYDRIKDGRMSWDFVRKMYKNAKDNGNKDQRRLIEKAFLSRIFDQKDAQGNIIPNELGVSAEDREKIFEKIDGADFKGVIGKESLDVTTESGKMAMDEIIKHRGADLIPQFLRNANKEQRQAASQYLNDKGVQWFVDNGAEDVLRYSLSSGAASLGINPIGGITQEELNQLIKPRASTESLNQEMGSIDAQLQSLDPTEDQNAIGNLKKRRKHLQEQIDARKAFAPEGVKSDDQRIKDQRTEYAYYEQELKDLETKPESEKNADYYKERAELVKKRDELAGEFKRRGLGIRETTTIPLEEQPLSVQIARLKAQEEQLKQIAGTQKRVLGVAIPLTGEAGVSYLPGEKARAELKKIQAKRNELEKQYADLTPGKLLDKEREAEALENKIIELEKTTQDVDRDIRTQQTLGGTEQQLQELRSLKQAQERELNRLKTEKEGLIRSWTGEKTATNLSLPEERIIAKDVAALRKEEQARTETVARLRTAKAAPKDIAAAQDVLRHVKNARQMAERKLVAHLETRSLADASTDFNDKAQDILNQRSQILQDLADIQTNIGSQQYQINTGRQTINNLEQQLSQMQEEATERLFRANPELGMGSRQFKRVVEQRTSNDSVVQDYQRRLNTTKQALSQAKKELDGLNSLPESTKTTLLPQALENVQATQHQLETIQQEMGATEANTRSRILQELGTEDLGLQLARHSSTLQGAVKNEVAQHPNWTTLNQQIKQGEEAVKQAQTNLRINTKKNVSLKKKRDELADRVDKLRVEQAKLDTKRQAIQEGEELIKKRDAGRDSLSPQEKQQIEQYLKTMQEIQDKNKKQVEDILKETKAP